MFSLDASMHVLALAFEHVPVSFFHCAAFSRTDQGSMLACYLGIISIH